MRIDDAVLKCVAFIGKVLHQDSNGVDGDFVGTGFFVSVPTDLPPFRFTFLATAKHVLEGLKHEEAYFAVNRKGGGLVYVLIDASNGWIFHPTDKTADIALYPIDPPDDFDFASISSVDFLTAESTKKYHIGIGDEVFMTGLFTPAQSSDRKLLPIIRHGNIAMLSDEQVQTEYGYADVILVEARSIGGLSGSPAFVRETIEVDVLCTDDGAKAKMAGLGRFQFLGVVHGHWDTEPSHINSYDVVDHDNGTSVNMGIGIVTPATKLLEILTEPSLVNEMKKAIEHKRRSMVPKMDVAGSPHEKFQALAQKVISVPKEEIDRREAQYQEERAKQPKRGPKT